MKEDSVLQKAALTNMQPIMMGLLQRILVIEGRSEEEAGNVDPLDVAVLFATILSEHAGPPKLPLTQLGAHRHLLSECANIVMDFIVGGQTDVSIMLPVMYGVRAVLTQGMNDRAITAVDNMLQAIIDHVQAGALLDKAVAEAMRVPTNKLN